MKNTHQKETGITPEEARICYAYYKIANDLLFGDGKSVRGVITQRILLRKRKTRGKEFKIKVYISGKELLMLQKIREARDAEEALEIYAFFCKDLASTGLSETWGKLDTDLSFHETHMERYFRFFQMVNVEPPPLPLEITKYFPKPLN